MPFFPDILTMHVSILLIVPNSLFKYLTSCSNLLSDAAFSCRVNINDMLGSRYDADKYATSFFCCYYEGSWRHPPFSFDYHREHAVRRCCRFSWLDLYVLVARLKVFVAAKAQSCDIIHHDIRPASRKGFLRPSFNLHQDE